MTSFVRKGWQVANDPDQVRWVAPVLLLAETVICAGIILKVPYTEIDWKAYMQQIAMYVDGERNYLKIYGDTGPLVYPGAHVYIYRFLYALTDEGQNIFLAQWLFAGLYLGTLYTVMKVYTQAGAPPLIFPLLILSKRLHSIFLLRLFNDGFVVLFLFIATFAYQKKLWLVGSISWSVALATKMSALLTLPAVAVILFNGVGRDRSLKQVAFMLQVQTMAGYEFLAVSLGAYLGRAFEFSRQFLFEWTVNWRFVGEETFLSRGFSIGLLVAHASLLLSFLNTRWLRPAGINLAGLENALLEPPTAAAQEKISKRMTPDFVAFTMLSSIIIGCLCARSLHYQFYAYIAWSTPYLLWRGGVHPILIYAIWLAQEWAWNVYPSTDASSMTVVACMALTLGLSWSGTSSAWKVVQSKQEK